MCVYIYMYVRVGTTYMCTYLHTYIHTYIPRAFRYIYIYKQTHAHAHARTHTHTQRDTHTHSHMHILICNNCVYYYIYMYIIFSHIYTWLRGLQTSEMLLEEGRSISMGSDGLSRAHMALGLRDHGVYRV